MSIPLFSLEDFGLRIEPTSAMRNGSQAVHQCSWCGAIVVWRPGAYRDELGACPACGRTAGWWQQQLPVAGIHRDEPEEATR